MGAVTSGVGRRPGRPSRLSKDPPTLGPAFAQGPRPGRWWGQVAGWAGSLDSTAEPQGFGGGLRATWRAQLGRLEPELLARGSSTQAPRGGVGRGPPCGAVRLESAP